VNNGPAPSWPEIVASRAVRCERNAVAAPAIVATVFRIICRGKRRRSRPAPAADAPSGTRHDDHRLNRTRYTPAVSFPQPLHDLHEPRPQFLFPLSTLRALSSLLTTRSNVYAGSTHGRIFQSRLSQLTPRSTRRLSTQSKPAAARADQRHRTFYITTADPRRFRPGRDTISTRSVDQEVCCGAGASRDWGLGVRARD
jgi:hypothetical protein